MVHRLLGCPIVVFVCPSSCIIIFLGTGPRAGTSVLSAKSQAGTISASASPGVCPARSTCRHQLHTSAGAASCVSCESGDDPRQYRQYH